MTDWWKLILVCALPLVAGCGSSDSNSQATRVIGVLLADSSDQFQVYLMEGMKESASKEPDVDVVFMDGKYDAGRQLQQAENLIVQNVSVIVLMAVDSEAAQPILTAAEDAAIPVILVNRKLPNQDYAISYVGSEDVVAGELEMSAVAESLNGKGRIVILEGTYGHEPQIRRRQGYDNIIAKNPEIEIVATQTGKWYRNEAMAVMENWLQADSELDAVVAQNDEMALGALKAIEDAGRLGEMVIAGIDATPEALKYVKDGKLNITVFQDAKQQGRTSIEVAVKVAQGQEVEKEILIPFELVTQNKADEYEQRYQSK